MGNKRGGGDLNLFRAILVMMALAGAAVANATAPVPVGHAYGGDRRQEIELYVPAGTQAVPLILFIHGGGWSAGSLNDSGGGQAAHFTGKGYGWATLEYRLVPAVRVEDQAADVARAIGWLARNAKRFRLDMHRVVLIGHSSGAQLAALVATDPHWLAKAGVPFQAIQGVISLDGAGIDVPGIMAAGASQSPFYIGAFGPDVARQTRLSPLAHVGPPDAPHWLFVYDEDHNQAAGYFAERFAEAGRAEGLKIEVVAATGTSHMGMLRALGTPNDAITRSVDAFVEAVLAPRPVQ
jgi:acetyl esterase/lipase